MKIDNGEETNNCCLCLARLLVPSLLCVGMELWKTKSGPRFAPSLFPTVGTHGSIRKQHFSVNTLRLLEPATHARCERSLYHGPGE